MIGDALVFDGVAHVFNFEKKNALGPAGELFNNHLYAFHAALTPEGQTVLPAEEFLRQWTVDEIDQMVYEGSDTDMLVAMPLPLTDLFRDGLSPWEVSTIRPRAAPVAGRPSRLGTPCWTPWTCTVRTTSATPSSPGWRTPVYPPGSSMRSALKVV